MATSFRRLLKHSRYARPTQLELRTVPIVEDDLRTISGRGSSRDERPAIGVALTCGTPQPAAHGGQIDCRVIEKQMLTCFQPATAQCMADAFRSLSMRARYQLLVGTLFLR